MSGIVNLPLLGKELSERANQKRTYQLRVIAGLAFALTFILEYWTGITRGYTADDLNFLGSGIVFFEHIALANMCVIYLLVPLLLAPSITSRAFVQ
ncbi:MAG: hypothetical protein ACI9TH_001722 [Kiritimatiellia bacterium]|jgi:hypothetical protein